MKLSTGKIAFPVEFDNGDKEFIYFNPNDPALAVRFKDFQTNMEEKINQIGEIELNNDGQPVDSQMVDILKDFQTTLYSELDKAFGSDVSSVVFKHCSPFAMVNGEYFIYLFIEAITPEIEKCQKKAQAEYAKKKEKKRPQYIGKYVK